MNKATELKLAYTVELLNESITKHIEIKKLIEARVLDFKNGDILGNSFLNKWDKPFNEIQDMLADVHNVLAKVCGQNLPVKKPGKKEDLNV